MRPSLAERVAMSAIKHSRRYHPRRSKRGRRIYRRRDLERKHAVDSQPERHVQEINSVTGDEELTAFARYRRRPHVLDYD
jgi:hypothetical protein